MIDPTHKGEFLSITLMPSKLSSCQETAQFTASSRQQTALSLLLSGPCRGHSRHSATQVHCQTHETSVLNCEGVVAVTRSRMQHTLQSQSLAAKLNNYIQSSCSPLMFH